MRDRLTEEDIVNRAARKKFWRDLLTYLREAVVGTRCPWCDRWIFFWEARYQLDGRWLHGECAVRHLEAQTRNLRRFARA